MAPKRPRDVNSLAKHITDEATGDARKTEPKDSGEGPGGSNSI
jgi:hypothetical protein